MAVFGGDHIYKFAIDQMEEEHRQSGAALTVAAFPVPIEEARQLEVIQIDENKRDHWFPRKPQIHLQF